MLPTTLIFFQLRSPLPRSALDFERKNGPPRDLGHNKISCCVLTLVARYFYPVAKSGIGFLYW